MASAQRDVTRYVTRDNGVTCAVTFDVSHGTPSRPVPTRPDPKGRGGSVQTLTSGLWSLAGESPQIHSSTRRTRKALVS